MVERSFFDINVVTNYSKFLALTLLCLLHSVSIAQYSQRIGISNTYPTTYGDWMNAFLSGNGKMGIMVFGNPLNETVIYNDRNFNLAKTKDRSFDQVNPVDVEKIKTLCAEGNFKEANQLAVSSAHYSAGGEGNKHPGYEMLINIPAGGPISNYSRICNFRTGEIIVKWTDKRGNWERKSFVSRQRNVVVQYLSAPSQGKLNCTIRLDTNAKMLFPKNTIFSNVSSASWLNMRVKYAQSINNAGYEGVVRVKVFGGKKEIKNNVLHIANADSVLMLTRTQKYDEECEKQWSRRNIQKELASMPISYNDLLMCQIKTYQLIYDRVKLDLHGDKADRQRTNEELLAIQKKSSVAIPALWERVFDAGRYYFLSSSSEAAPPDLLGIWAGDCNAGWGGFYHLDANVNLQVAGGNIGDMPEAMEGYFKINEGWQADFRTNASKLLGCRGMLAAGNTPGASSGLMAAINSYYPYQYATGEEGWLLYPFWEHYLISGDKKFLQDRLYPLLKDMGYFYEDFLTHTDGNGKFIFAGSVSPENQPSNLNVSLLNNSNFDISGCKFCLNALIETCKILNIETGRGEGVERWTRILAKLPPYLINSDGAMQEWSWPGLADHYDHRHSSQLLPVWPYREINADQDTVLYNAARITLAKKDAFNYSNTGHGLLHSALIAAGLNSSKSVNTKLLRLTKEDFYFNSLASSHNAGHVTFCTDACNTVPAIMMEMLVSSSPGAIELLPALPDILKQGAISGIKCRNRVTLINMDWNMYTRVINCTLRSDVTQNIKLIERVGIRDLQTRATSSVISPIANNILFKAGVNTKVSITIQ